MKTRPLYPSLAAHPDAGASSVSQRYSNAMVSIAAAFGHCMAKWQTTAQMRANPAHFTAAGKGILRTLHKRIHRENSELHPLLDKLDA